MNDSDDKKLKAEIDGIVSNINKIMERIEDLGLINQDDSRQNKE